MAKVNSEAGLNENMFDPLKNSEANLRYYDALAAFFSEDPAGALLKARSFALYSPRQVITDFLVRYELFKKVADIPGSILEFGVLNGQGLMSFAHCSSILEPNNVNRKIYGFDTFEGFKGLSEKDSKGTSPLLQEKGMGLDSYGRLMKAIELYDQNRFIGHSKKVELIRGDVLMTLKPFLEENPHLLVSLLYLDLDIYKPTKFVLENLLNRVPKGGVVAFDELNMKEFPGETLAFLETLKLSEVALKRLPFCSRISYFVK